MSIPKFLPRKDRGQFANGRLHWLAKESGRWDIVSLCLVDEKYDIVPWPESILHRRTLGGYRSLVIDDYSVWVMKEYGEAESWTKI